MSAQESSSFTERFLKALRLVAFDDEPTLLSAIELGIGLVVCKAEDQQLASFGESIICFIFAVQNYEVL